MMCKKLPYNFLEIAQSDLRAAECLFKNGFYPQSLFFLQQSVEKATKTFSIKVGLLKNEKEIKSLMMCVKITINITNRFKHLNCHSYLKIFL